MLDGINDSEENAEELAKLVKGMNCYINLIPYNETNNIEFKRTNAVNIMRFYDILKKNNMKGLNFLAAFLGGAAIGAALGILFAPEKGEDTRQKIKDILREKGIKLNRSEMDELVDKIAAEVKDAVD